MQVVLGRQMGGHNPRCSQGKGVETQNKSSTACFIVCSVFLNRNRILCYEKKSLGTNHALYVHPTYKDVLLFSEWVGPRFKLLESLPNKKKVQVRSHHVRVLLRKL